MYDYVIADNAPKPRTMIVYREDIGDGISETTIAVFFVTKYSTIKQCVDLADIISAKLNNNIEGA